MTVTVDDLRNEVNTSTADDAVLTRVLLVSEAMLAQYVADNANAEPHGIPDPVYDEALLAVAVDMFNRRQAPNGILTQQFDAAGDGIAVNPVRVSNDPLRVARPLLSMWCTQIVLA